MFIPPYEYRFETIVEHWESHRAPLAGSTADLPRRGANPGASANSIVPDIPATAGRFNTKKQHVAEEFIGKSELCLLNGCLTATLRKRDYPRRSPSLPASVKCAAPCLRSKGQHDG